MRSLRRRGHGLLELLLVLTILALLAPVVGRVARAAAGAATLAAARLAAERDATTVIGLLRHDLRTAVASAVAVPDSTVLEYSRPIGEGLACALGPDGVVVRARSWVATRMPDAGRDRMLVLVGAEPATWLDRAVANVSSRDCPDGGAGVLLTPDLPVAAALVVRIEEPVRLRSYTSGGRGWLGLEPRDGRASIQPFAGPLRPGGWRLDRVGDRLEVSLHGAGGVVAAFTLPLE